MSREDTMICMDNSEWMRNGDFSRTRFEAQYQAIEHVLRVKTGNVENTVGLLSLAGGVNVGVQVLCSPTTERYKVGKAAQNAKIGGRADLLTGLKVAQLALKYRPNRRIQARIVVFIGSPLDKTDQTQLTKIAKGLKKNNIAVDVVSMGEQSVNEPILRKFIKDVEKKDSGIASTLVIVPPGTYVEDSIRSSAMSGGSMAEEESDPLLAMALAESRAMAEAQANRDGGSPAGSSPANNDADSSPGNKVPQKLDNFSIAATEGTARRDALDDDDDDDEDAILEQAKLMSLMEENQKQADSSGTSGASSALGNKFFRNMVEKAGINVNSKEVKQELDELQKASKQDDKDKKDDKKK